MTLRAVVQSLGVVLLSCSYALASQPSAKAGRLILQEPVIAPIPGDPNPPVSCAGFAWFQSVFDEPLDPSDTLTLQFAIIPVHGDTSVFLHGGNTLPALLARVGFSESTGTVSGGLPYKRSSWNDVSVELRPVTQDYMVTVNGTQAGPFPFHDPNICQRFGGCVNVSAIRIGGAGGNDLRSWGDDGWIDSISLVRNSPAGQATVYQQDFDACVSPSPYVGGLLISDPPRIPPGRRTSGAGGPD